MEIKKNAEFDNTVRYHFALVGFVDFKDIIKKFVSSFNYYRFENQGKENSKEVICDVADDLLSDAGIVVTKLYNHGRAYLQVSKISMLSGELKRPSKTYNLGQIRREEEPSDYSLQVASAIEGAFTTQFTVDIDAFIKQTSPKIEIDIEATKYRIIGGTGYRAYMLFENATYQDVNSKKKVSRMGVTLLLPSEDKENEFILETIDKKINDIALYNLSRFEIAKKLLYSTEELSEEELSEEEED